MPTGVPAGPIAESPLNDDPVRQPSVARRNRRGDTDTTVRGRFEKSEPTIVDGEDLDVPTFMRKNLKMK